MQMKEMPPNWHKERGVWLSLLREARYVNAGGVYSSATATIPRTIAPRRRNTRSQRSHLTTEAGAVGAVKYGLVR
ncbi:hypothetical protein ON010_g5457 [Phytophthora cinnamomi]|nr:hypothetical protein ON010_g5457 [Phytophthora cinnamomi]